MDDAPQPAPYLVHMLTKLYITGSCTVLNMHVYNIIQSCVIVFDAVSLF